MGLPAIGMPVFRIRVRDEDAPSWSAAGRLAPRMQCWDKLAMTPAKVLVIDDDADFRQLLVTLLQTDPRVRVSGQAGDGEAALDLVRRETPRIVLMDLMMPRVDGLEATRRIKHMAPETKVVVLSSIADERYRRLAFDSGADVFLNKRDTLIALVPTIRNLIEDF